MSGQEAEARETLNLTTCSSSASVSLFQCVVLLSLSLSVFLSVCVSDAEFPFNEERVIPDGVNRDSAIIGGTPRHRACESVLCLVCT